MKIVNIQMYLIVRLKTEKILLQSMKSHRVPVATELFGRAITKKKIIFNQ